MPPFQRQAIFVVSLLSCSINRSFRQPCETVYSPALLTKPLGAYSTSYNPFSPTNMAAEHPIPPASEEKTTFRQSPMLQFFLAKDTSKHDDPRGRVRTVPMKVLCLGLPRSATESLAKALEILGKSTYHDKSYTTSVLIRITLSSHESVGNAS